MSDRVTPWVKSAASNEQGSCVEMRRHDGMIEVRDTKRLMQNSVRTRRSSSVVPVQDRDHIS
jgi:hypothetical protein